MRKEHDFSDSKPNPYYHKIKKQISIRIDVSTLKYFKSLSGEAGIPYQKLMNLYLADCAEKHLKPKIEWSK